MTPFIRPVLVLTSAYLLWGCETVVLNADAEAPTARLADSAESFDLPGEPPGDRFVQERTNEVNSLSKTGIGSVASPQVYDISDEDEAIAGRASFGTRFLFSEGRERLYFPERVSLYSVPFEVNDKIIEVSWQGKVPELERVLGKTSPSAVRIAVISADGVRVPVAKLSFLNFRRESGDDELDPRRGEHSTSSCYTVIVSVPRIATEDDPDTESQVGRFMSRFDLPHRMKMTLISGAGRFTLDAEGVLVKPDNYLEIGDPGWCSEGVIGDAQIRASFPRNSLVDGAALQFSVQPGYIDEFWPPNRYDYLFDDVKALYYR